MQGKSASAYNRELYDSVWEGQRDFIRYNPGARWRRRFTLDLVDAAGLDRDGSSLLDVGCGNGELLSELHSLYPNVKLAGADLSEAVVEANQRRFPEMRFFALDVEKAALEERFDCIVSCEVIEHLDDREAAFEHFAEMLRPGGHLVLTCPTGRVFPTEKHFGHTTHPTPGEIGERASRNGFAVKRLINWGFPTYYALKWATNVNPEWALKNFSNTQYGAKQIVVSEALYWLNRLNLRSSPVGCQLFVLLEKRR